MKTICTIAALLAALSGAVQAQTKADDQADHRVDHPSAATHASAADMTEGEVRKVDKDARKLTIEHGDIKNPDRPPMTMVFQLKEGVMMDNVKAGDKIRFVVEKAGSGFVVTTLEIAR